jgi:hypothetical protein
MMALALGLLATGAPRKCSAQCAGVIALGGVSSMSGNPLQAEVKTTRNPEARSLSPLVGEKPQLVARDSQGRVRVERDLGAFKVQGEGGQETEVERHLISICDPVSQELITLDTLNKTATVQKPLGRWNQRTETPGATKPNFCDRQLRLGINLPNVQRESLGHQTIQGFDAQGVLEKRTMAMQANGATESPTIETQIWCSEDLGAVVLRVMGNSQKNGTQQIAMTNIQRVEPDAGLFVTPADYKVVERVPNGVSRSRTGASGEAGTMTPVSPATEAQKP